MLTKMGRIWFVLSFIAAGVFFLFTFKSLLLSVIDMIGIVFNGNYNRIY